MKLIYRVRNGVCEAIDHKLFEKVDIDFEDDEPEPFVYYTEDEYGVDDDGWQYEVGTHVFRLYKSQKLGLVFRHTFWSAVQNRDDIDEAYLVDEIELTENYLKRAKK